MNKYVIVFIVAAISLLTIPAVMADDGDLFIFGEVPLMNSMTVVDDSDIQFDKPSGRIMKTTIEFEGRQTVNANAPKRDFEPSVKEFYTRALPQLGWEKISGSKYRREGEILLFNFPDDRPQKMIVTLRPAGSGDDIKPNLKPGENAE
jgi:hypothetical protein